MGIHFEKMHGLGNDFVIIDARHASMQRAGEGLSPEKVRALAERTTGIGCDQVIMLRPSEQAEASMQIFNADGSEVAACGNATRCVAWLLMRELHKDTVLIETEAGLLECHRAGPQQVRVNMGRPRLGWQEIPLAREADTLHLELTAPSLPATAVAVNVGNPHAVFFVENIAAIPLAEIGPALEHDPLFPERANISVAEVTDSTHMRLRTWERGAGETLACGTAACASVVAARRRGLVEPEVVVTTDGGELTIAWEGNEADPAHAIRMTGPVAHVFSGELRDSEWV